MFRCPDYLSFKQNKTKIKFDRQWIILFVVFLNEPVYNMWPESCVVESWKNTF